MFRSNRGSFGGPEHIRSRSMVRFTLAIMMVAPSALMGQTALPASSKPDAAVAPSKSPARSVAVPSAPVAALPASKIRLAIAEVLEAEPGYRTSLDGGAPRLLEPQLAGPLQRSVDLFRSPETIYCVSTKLDIVPWPTRRVALVRVAPGENGRVNVSGSISLTNVPLGCRLVKYEPFPELAARRQKRRQLLGKP